MTIAGTNDTIAAIKGGLMATIVAAVGIGAFCKAPIFDLIAIASLLAFIVVNIPQAGRASNSLLALSLAVGGYALIALPDGPEIVHAGLRRACFFGAFFTALGFLREPAHESPVVRNCGRDLLKQPARFRYLALTFGAHILGLMISIGSIPVLLSMLRTAGATRAGADEPVSELERTAAVAVLRGFNVNNNWSPFASAPVIILTTIPTVSWAALMTTGFALALSLMTIGYWIECGRLPNASNATHSMGGILRSGAMLLGCFLLVLAATSVVKLSAGFKFPVAIIVTIPVYAVFWIFLQELSARRRIVGSCLARLRHLICSILPESGSEVSLLSLAGFATVLVSAFHADRMIADAFRYLPLPDVSVPLLLQWSVVGLALLGLSPAMTVPVLGSAIYVVFNGDVAPLALAIAMFGGWATSTSLSSTTSATVMVGRMIGVPPQTVSYQWNGFFGLAATLVYSTAIVTVALSIR